MTDTFRWVLIAIGALTIAGGLFGYFKDTSRWTPAVFVAFGVALCGVANIKMSFGPQGGSLEIGQEVAAASQANAEFVTQQQAAIQALGDRVGQLTAAMDTMRKQIDARPAQANAAPLVLPHLDAIIAAQPKLRATLDASATAKFKVVNANRNLQAAVLAAH